MGRLGQENSLKPPQESYKAFLKNTTNLKQHFPLSLAEDLKKPLNGYDSPLQGSFL